MVLKIISTTQHDTEEIIPVLIEGMKELQKQIDELKLNSHET